MKKYIKLTILLGLFYGSTPIVAAEESSWIPEEVRYTAIATMVSVLSTIIIRKLQDLLDTPKPHSESLWAYFTKKAPNLDVSTNAELQNKLEGDCILPGSMPASIHTILSQEKDSGINERQLIILYGQSSTGKTKLAEQIALHTGGNYYHVHQAYFDHHDDITVARFLRGYVEKISKETTGGKISTLHLENFGKQLDASNHASNNIWKLLFRDFKKNYANVRIVACSDVVKFDKDAVAYGIAHAIQIKMPNKAARKNYLKTVCAAYLTAQSIRHAKEKISSLHKQTGLWSAVKKMFIPGYKQKMQDELLSEQFLVTTAMHQAAATKLDEKVQAISSPFSWWPTTWIKTWNDNAPARKLNAAGYVTPVIDCNLDKESLTQVEDKFARLTKGLNYKQLEEITESTRIAKLKEIKKAKKYITKKSDIYTMGIENREIIMTEEGEDPKAIKFRTIHAADLIHEANKYRLKADFIHEANKYRLKNETSRNSQSIANLNLHRRSLNLA